MRMVAMREHVVAQEPVLAAAVARRKKTKTAAAKLEAAVERSAISYYLQTEERRVLEAIDDELVEMRRAMDVFIHDGGRVLRLDDELESHRSCCAGWRPA